MWFPDRLQVMINLIYKYWMNHVLLYGKLYEVNNWNHQIFKL